jgi:Rps23 Pro-64 3,4-dihydroxylase Tpa1-like proline 4-hydroxylase
MTTEALDANSSNQHDKKYSLQKIYTFLFNLFLCMLACLGILMIGIIIYKSFAYRETFSISTTFLTDERYPTTEKIVTSFVWPGLILLVLVIFKKDISELLERLQKVELKGVALVLKNNQSMLDKLTIESLKKQVAQKEQTTHDMPEEMPIRSSESEISESIRSLVNESIMPPAMSPTTTRAKGRVEKILNTVQLKNISKSAKEKPEQDIRSQSKNEYSPILPDNALEIRRIADMELEYALSFLDYDIPASFQRAFNAMNQTIARISQHYGIHDDIMQDKYDNVWTARGLTPSFVKISYRNFYNVNKNVDVNANLSREDGIAYQKQIAQFISAILPEAYA